MYFRFSYYMQEHYFSRDSYLKLSGRPVLLSWGPTYFQFNTQKDQVLGRVWPKPWWVTLDWGSETADLFGREREDGQAGGVA